MPKTLTERAVTITWRGKQWALRQFAKRVGCPLCAVRGLRREHPRQYARDAQGETVFWVLRCPVTGKALLEEVASLKTFVVDLADDRYFELV